MTRIWAAVPVKEFTGAKQRLAPLLTPAQRQALARAMLQDVLDALTAAPLAGVILNTLEPEAIALARRCGVRVVASEARSGHTGAVMAMARLLKSEGADGILTCPGDIPAVTSAEIAAVLQAHQPAPAFTIVPAHDHRGSNTVVMSPPDLVRLQFGDDSFVPHLSLARAAGIEPTMVTQPGIAQDIDGPADARAFLMSGLGPQTRARGLLTEWVK
jgi:2-phospho-L-lactate guanylyltransferase